MPVPRSRIGADLAMEENDAVRRFGGRGGFWSLLGQQLFVTTRRSTSASASAGAMQCNDLKMIALVLRPTPRG